MFKKRILKFLGIEEYIKKIEQLERREEELIEGMKNLKQKVEYLEKFQETLVGEIGEVREELKNIIEDISQLRAENEKIKHIVDRLDNIERRLYDIEKSHVGKIGAIQKDDDDIESMIIGLASIGEGVCISDLLNNLKISKRRLYDVLAKMEESGKIERKKIGRKVYVKVVK